VQGTDPPLPVLLGVVAGTLPAYSGGLRGLRGIGFHLSVVTGGGVGVPVDQDVAAAVLVPVAGDAPEHGASDVVLPAGEVGEMLEGAGGEHQDMPVPVMAVVRRP
jgi:hypothetical protein